MGLFDSLSGSLFGSADPGGIGTGGQGAQVSNSSIVQQTGFLPMFNQLLFASSALGVSLSSLFGDALVSASSPEGKALKKASKKGSATVLPFGGSFVDFDKLLPKLPQIFDTLETAQNEKFTTTFDKLSKVPALAGIFDQAGGGPGPLQGKIDKAFNTMGEFALGAAAKTGLLNNSLVQAKALAPLALQKAQYEVGFQEAKQAQALGLAGAGGLTGSSPVFTQAVPAPQSFAPGIAQAAQTSGFLSAQNQQAQLTASMFNTQSGQDLFGTLLGFGTFAGAGGFSGGGFYGPGGGAGGGG